MTLVISKVKGFNYNVTRLELSFGKKWFQSQSNKKFIWVHKYSFYFILYKICRRYLYGKVRNEKIQNLDLHHLALQPFVGFRLLCQVSTNSSILSRLLPVFQFQLFQISHDILLPSLSWSSYWSISHRSLTSQLVLLGPLVGYVPAI